MDTGCNPGTLTGNFSIAVTGVAAPAGQGGRRS
jgi:hypothetical protein